MKGAAQGSHPFAVSAFHGGVLLFEPQRCTGGWYTIVSLPADADALSEKFNKVVWCEFGRRVFVTAPVREAEATRLRPEAAVHEGFALRLEVCSGEAGAESGQGEEVESSSVSGCFHDHKGMSSRYPNKYPSSCCVMWNRSRY
jgi:hypothetical protein